MADILSDLYPIPIVFVDGQQPDAKLLNAWADQIDTAFAILARIVGDFDGENSETAAYISNMVRSLGSMGHLNPRLPKGLSYGLTAPNRATLIESLASSEDQREHLLSFVPDAGSVLGDFDGDNTYGDDWTYVATPESNPYLSLGVADRWGAFGRRVLTSSQIISTAKVKYTVDDPATENYESYADTSGANVIPSLYEIADVDITALCTYSESMGVKYISFPYILRAGNPEDPFSIDDAIVLTSDEMLGVANGSHLKWASSATTPKYTVPPYIYTLAQADVDNKIPDGLCSLWVDDGTTIYRIVNQNSEDQISFFVDDTTRTRIIIELPGSLALPHIANAGLINRYIVGFAGVSVAEALGFVKNRAAAHAHDGTDESSAISAQHLVDRFNPDEFTHSFIQNNLFPQYLERRGYFAAGDSRNRNNAYLGNLFIADSRATVSNTTGETAGDGTSYKLVLGSFTVGPTLQADFTHTTDYSSVDSAVSLDQTFNAGKLIVDKKSMRLVGDLMFGDSSNITQIASRTATHSTGAAYKTVRVINSINSIVLSSSELRAENNILRFGNDLDNVDEMMLTVYRGGDSSSRAEGADDNGAMVSFETYDPASEDLISARLYSLIAEKTVVSESVVADWIEIGNYGTLDPGDIRSASWGATVYLHLNALDMVPSNIGDDSGLAAREGWRMISTTYGTAAASGNAVVDQLYNNQTNTAPFKYPVPYWKFVDPSGGPNGILIAEIKIPPSVSAASRNDGNDGMYFAGCSLRIGDSTGAGLSMGAGSDQRLWAQIIRMPYSSVVVRDPNPNVPIMTAQYINVTNPDFSGEDGTRGIYADAVPRTELQLVAGGFSPWGLSPVGSSGDVGGGDASYVEGDSGALSTSSYDTAIDTANYRYFLVISTDKDEICAFSARVAIWCRYIG